MLLRKVNLGYHGENAIVGQFDQCFFKEADGLRYSVAIHFMHSDFCPAHQMPSRDTSDRSGRTRSRADSRRSRVAAQQAGENSRLVSVAFAFDAVQL